MSFDADLPDEAREAILNLLRARDLDAEWNGFTFRTLFADAIEGLVMQGYPLAAQMMRDQLEDLERLERRERAARAWCAPRAPRGLDS